MGNIRKTRRQMPGPVVRPVATPGTAPRLDRPRRRAPAHGARVHGFGFRATPSTPPLPSRSPRRRRAGANIAAARDPGGGDLRVSGELRAARSGWFKYVAGILYRLEFSATREMPDRFIAQDINKSSFFLTVCKIMSRHLIFFGTNAILPRPAAAPTLPRHHLRGR
ncbi:hypothetical protein ACFSKM_05915 [Ancylobacter dichloromethanicus]